MALTQSGRHGLRRSAPDRRLRAAFRSAGLGGGCTQINSKCVAHDVNHDGIVPDAAFPGEATLSSGSAVVGREMRAGGTELDMFDGLEVGR